MSTYTDLHNRVKETLTVDYHSRVTPQVISALNQENEFWGRFRGSFAGDVQISSLSGLAIFDGDFVRGRQLSSTMDSPRLFLSVDEESGEDVVQDLTAYIAERCAGGISPADLSDYYKKTETSSAVEISARFGAVESDIGSLAQASADHDGRIAMLETSAMMLSGGEFVGGVSFRKGEADLSVGFSSVIASDNYALSAFFEPLPESATIFGVCVRINDMIRFSGTGIEPVPYDTADIEDMFDAVKELTGIEPTDIGSVRAALNGALATLTLGPAGRTLEGRLGILSERDDGIIERVDALSAEIAKASVLAEVSAFLSGEIDKKAGSSELTAYALSADVMSRETAARRFDGVNGRIDDALAKLKAVYSALSGLPPNPAEFNLIENVAPALIALRSALSAFA